MSRNQKKKQRSALPRLILLLCLLLALGCVLYARLGAPGLPAAPAPAASSQPETAPTAAPTAAPEASTPSEAPAAPEITETSVRISEVMPSNKSTLADGGLFPDWVELYNAGAESASLSS